MATSYIKLNGNCNNPIKIKTKKVVKKSSNKHQRAAFHLMSKYKQILKENIGNFGVDYDIEDLKGYDFDKIKDLFLEVLKNGEFKGKKYQAVSLGDLLLMSLADERYLDLLGDPNICEDKFEVFSKFVRNGCSYDVIEKLMNLNDYRYRSLSVIFDAGYDYLKYVSEDYSDEQVIALALAANVGVDPRLVDDLSYSENKIGLKVHMIKSNSKFINVDNIQSDYLCSLLASMFTHNLSFPDLDYQTIGDNEKFMCEICHNLKLADTDEYLTNKYLPGEELYSRLLWLIRYSHQRYFNMVEIFFKGCKDYSVYASKFDDIRDDVSEKFIEWATDYFEIVLLRENVEDYEKALSVFSKNSRRKSKVEGRDFTNEQLETITYGWRLGLPIESFAKSDYSVEFMEIVIDLLYRGFDSSKVSFDKFQLNQLKLLQQAFLNNLDVELFANPDMKYSHMKLLYQDLVSGLDVTAYANPEMPFRKVKELSNKNRLQQEETIKRLGLYV